MGKQTSEVLETLEVSTCGNGMAAEQPVEACYDHLLITQEFVYFLCNFSRG